MSNICLHFWNIFRWSSGSVLTQILPLSICINFKLFEQHNNKSSVKFARTGKVQLKKNVIGSHRSQFFGPPRRRPQFTGGPKHGMLLGLTSCRAVNVISVGRILTVLGYLSFCMSPLALSIDGVIGAHFCIAYRTTFRPRGVWS